MTNHSDSALFHKKPHYELLDGLRGVAAILVILFHFGEGFATSAVDQFINHGYLAVDFFFVLSGFVLGYAYDDRWKRGLTKGEFIVRRIIRLQPMVVAAVILGLIAYIVQGCEHWDHTPASPWAVAVAFILALFMIPVVPGMSADVRGNGEMFPLVGPAWSLFFEYIGSILYAIWLHRLSNKALKVVVGISGAALVVIAVCNLSESYSIGLGWSMAGWGFFGGLMRLGFSFGIGLLMSRNFKPSKLKCDFALCTLILVALMAMPYVTFDGNASVLNGIYDIICTLVVFPVLVYMAASADAAKKRSNRMCSFLGRISYPVYIIHYPAMYLFYAWVWDNAITLETALPVMGAIFIGLIPAAWLFVRFYDEPVRQKLNLLLKNRINRKLEKRLEATNTNNR